MTSKKYESAVEKAAVDAFKKEFERLHYRISLFSNIARREGILAVEALIDKEDENDPFGFALQMAYDGIERESIEKYLDSWIEANCSGHCEYYNRILFSVIKTGVLFIQSGANPRIIDPLIKSLVPLELMPYWTEYYPEAVKQYGWLLACVPEGFRTEELCRNAIKNCGDMLRYVPDEFKTKKLCIEAVKQDGKALKFMPRKFKTQELCCEAVKNDGDALAFVPEEFITKELCLEAVEYKGSALEFVPEEFITKELCVKATENSSCALRFVPKEFKTAEFCLAAVKKQCDAINYVPKHLRTLEFYVEVIKQRRSEEYGLGDVQMKVLLEDVPVSFRNEVWEAVHKSELEEKV